MVHGHKVDSTVFRALDIFGSASIRYPQMWCSDIRRYKVDIHRFAGLYAYGSERLLREEAVGKGSSSKELLEPFPAAGVFHCSRERLLQQAGRQWDITLLFLAV